MRILHLVESPTPAPGRRAAPDASEGALLACAGTIRAMPAEHEVVLVGPSAADAVARALGLPTDARISPPLGNPRWGAPSLQAWLAGRRRADLVCAWSAGAVALANLVRLRPLAAILLGPPSPSHAPTVPLADVDAAFVASVADRAAWSNVPKLVRLAAHSMPGDPRPIREHLGLGRGRVGVVHLADPPEAGDPVRFLFIAGLVDRAERPLVAIVPRAHRELSRLRRLHAHGSGRLGLVITDHPLHAVQPACDLALIDGGDWAHQGQPPPLTGATRVAIAAAGGAGVRVIAPPFQGSEREAVLSSRGVAPQELAATMLQAIEQRAEVPSMPEELDIPSLSDALRGVAGSRTAANVRRRLALPRLSILD